MYHFSEKAPRGYTPYESSPNSSYEDNIYETPKRHHTRQYSYGATPTKPTWTSWSPHGHQNTGIYESVHSRASPSRKADVSGTKSGKTKPRNHTIFGGRTPGTAPRTQKQFIYVDDSDDAGDSPVNYEYREPRPRRYSKPSANEYFYFRQDVEEEPKKTRTRRASTNTRSSPKTPKSSSKSPPKATEADAKRAGIPTGYSIKNWDPTESPVILLGSVFDANSLGKWIYDWTVYHHGASTPMADVAGDLWLLLIKLAGKMKRAQECVRRIKNYNDRETMQDFIESGSRLWLRFKELLKTCEKYMWKAAKRDNSKGGVSMGKNAGIEFVESIFGRERQLEGTERLMQSLRLWTMRFDSNCSHLCR